MSNITYVPFNLNSDPKKEIHPKYNKQQITNYNLPKFPLLDHIKSAFIEVKRFVPFMQLQIPPFFGKRICKKQWNFLLASLPQNILPAKCYIQIHISDFHGKCRHELGYNLFYAFYVALFISQRHQITSSMGPQFIHIKMYILSLVAGRNCGANININPKNSKMFPGPKKLDTI